MIFSICQDCKEQGVIPGYDALLNMKTDDGVQLCGLCERRLTGKTVHNIHVHVRRVARDVYGVLPLIEPFLEMLSEQESAETQAFYKEQKW